MRYWRLISGVFAICAMCVLFFNISRNLFKIQTFNSEIVPVPIVKLESPTMFLPPRIRSIFSKPKMLIPPIASVDILVLVVTVPWKVPDLLDRYELMFPVNITIGSSNELSLLTVLVLCKNESVSIQDHQKLYHVKIWQIDCVESYYRLNDKTREMLLKVSDYFDFSFLFKFDDDTYPCFSNILNKVFSMKSVSIYPSYVGKLATQTVVTTEPGLWFDPTFLNSYPGQKTYSDFMKGAGYGLSSHLVYLLSETDQDLQKLQNEDVMVGSWLLPFRKNIIPLTLRAVCYCSPLNKRPLWISPNENNRTISLANYLRLFPPPDMYHHCDDNDWEVCRTFNRTCHPLDVAPEYLKNASDYAVQVALKEKEENREHE